MSYTNYNQGWRRNKLSEPCQFLAGNDIFHPSATQNYMLGCIFEMNDGRMFRYCKAGAADITRARMCASEGPTSTLEERVIGAAVAKGKVKFDITVGSSTGIIAHELIDGYLFVNKVATVLGDFYIIKDNYWTTASTVLNLELADAGGLRTALGAADEVCVIKNKCRDVVVNPTAMAAQVIGVPLVDIAYATAPYFWAQFRGICPLICDAGDAPAIGGPAGYPTGTPAAAGTVGVGANDGSDPTWGVYVSAGAASEISLVDLLIP